LQYLKKTYGDTISVKSYASIQNAFIDMSSGRIDLVMGDTPIMLDWLKQHGEGKFHITGTPIMDPIFFGLGYGIAVRKGDIVSLEAINRAIKNLQKNGVLNKITVKYFG
jgi:arginine transport system substrate-binding protein